MTSLRHLHDDLPIFFVLFSCSRWTSGVAPLPAHPHPEAAGVPWGPPASAVHRLLPGSVSGTAVASRWPRCDHTGGQRHLRGGDPSSWLLPADQVLTEQRGRNRSWELLDLLHSLFTSIGEAEIDRLRHKSYISDFFYFNFTLNWSHEAQRNIKPFHSLFIESCGNEKQQSETVTHGSHNLALCFWLLW